MKALVTGGGGFLGKALALRLVTEGWEVHSLSRKQYPELAALHIQHHAADLNDLEALRRAARGCDVLFHVAAKAGVWGPYRAYHAANVTATEHCLEACRVENVPILVFTSSPSVTFAGSDQRGVDEREPYPARYLAFYPQTKAAAEKLVLAAHGSPLADGRPLATVALRPHLIWGPGDPHLAPRIVEKARQGRLRLLGDGSQKIDTTYIANAVEAHGLAAQALLKDGVKAACGGRAYFISNGEPWPIKDVLNAILAAAGQPPVTRSISPRLAYAVGAALEAWYWLMGKQDEPPMTRFVARQLATDHWFDLSAARRDFGYRPVVDLRTGFQRLAEHFQAQGQADPSA